MKRAVFAIVSGYSGTSEEDVCYGYVSSKEEAEKTVAELAEKAPRLHERWFYEEICPFDIEDILS